MIRITEVADVRGATHAAAQTAAASRVDVAVAVDGCQRLAVTPKPAPPDTV